MTALARRQTAVPFVAIVAAGIIAIGYPFNFLIA
jgi:hypothetical protein